MIQPRTFKVYSENEMNKTGELCELAKGTRAGNKEALNLECETDRRAGRCCPVSSGYMNWYILLLSSEMHNVQRTACKIKRIYY